MGTYGGYTTATASASTTCAVNKPTGTATGDLLVACIAKNTTGSPTHPSGWATITTSTTFKTSTQATLLANGCGIAYKWITDGASEPSSYTWTSTSSEWSVTIIRIAGYTPPILTAAGGIISATAFDWGFGFSRSGTQLSVGNDQPYWSDRCHDRYWLIAAPTITEAAATRTLSNPGSILTQVSNNALVGVSQLVAYAEIDTAEGYDIDGITCDVDAASGTGRGYALLIADPTSTIEYADARAHSRRPSLSRAVHA